jgi:hypothetical protein
MAYRFADPYRQPPLEEPGLLDELFGMCNRLYGPAAQSWRNRWHALVVTSLVAGLLYGGVYVPFQTYMTACDRERLAQYQQVYPYFPTTAAAAANVSAVESGYTKWLDMENLDGNIPFYTTLWTLSGSIDRLAMEHAGQREVKEAVEELNMRKAAIIRAATDVLATKFGFNEVVAMKSKSEKLMPRFEPSDAASTQSYHMLKRGLLASPLWALLINLVLLRWRRKSVQREIVHHTTRLALASVCWPLAWLIGYPQKGMKQRAMNLTWWFATALSAFMSMTGSLAGKAQIQLPPPAKEKDKKSSTTKRSSFQIAAATEDSGEPINLRGGFLRTTYSWSKGWLVEIVTAAKTTNTGTTVNNWSTAGRWWQIKPTPRSTLIVTGMAGTRFTYTQNPTGRVSKPWFGLVKGQSFFFHPNVRNLMPVADFDARPNLVRLTVVDQLLFKVRARSYLGAEGSFVRTWGKPTSGNVGPSFMLDVKPGKIVADITAYRQLPAAGPGYWTFRFRVIQTWKR